MIFFLLATLALGPEIPVTQSPRLLTTTVAPGMPRVISDGNGFLVSLQRGDAFARVNSDGEVVDRPSIRVAPPPNVRWFDLIRHRDADVVGWYYFLDPGIVHVRVGTMTSTLFDVALPDADINSDTFKLMSNGTTLAAMFQRRGSGSSILFFDSGRSVSLPVSGEVATDGANFLVLQGSSALLLSGSGDLLGNVAFSFTASDVVFDGTDFVIAGVSGVSIEFVRVSRSGTVTSPPGVVDSATGSITGVTVAATASNFFISWKEVYPGAFPSSGETVSLQARSVSRAGVVRTVSDPMRETVGRFAAWTDPPALASNGRNYLLVWTEGTSLESLPTRSLFSLLLSPMESLSTADVDRRKRPLPSAIATQSSPTSARNGDRLLLAWSETFSDDNSGNFRQQIVADDVVVAPSDAQQQNASAAWDGKRTWIAWNRSLSGIDATYVLPDGSRRGVALSISSGGVAPRIACGDDTCLLVWAENRSRATNTHELFAARIVHGELLDLNGFLIGSGQSYVGVDDYGVATDGARFEVVWADRIFSGGAILHSVSFGPLDRGITTRNGDLAATTNSYGSPHIVWNGREFNVLWLEGTTLRGSSVDSAGASLDGDATGWAGVRIGVKQSLHSLAFAGTLYVAADNVVMRVDPLTTAIVDTIDIGYPATIAALDSQHVFVLYSRELQQTFGFPLFFRQFIQGRRRAARG